MKKVFIILIMVLYGLSSSGMTLNLHYCCGKLDDISFSGKHSEDCAMGEETKMSNCCNDQQITVKVNPDQQPTAKTLQLAKTFITVPFTSPAFAGETYPRVVKNTFSPETPPPVSPIPLFITNCVFRV